MGNIRNRKSHSETRVDWEFLNDCFPRNIKPTDIDGFVEINSQALILEHKQKDQKIEWTQELAFKNIIKKNEIRVIVFWADLDTEGNITKLYSSRIYDSINGRVSIKNDYWPNIQNLKKKIKEWVEWAEKK